MSHTAIKDVKQYSVCVPPHPPPSFNHYHRTHQSYSRETCMSTGLDTHVHPHFIRNVRAAFFTLAKWKRLQVCHVLDGHVAYSRAHCSHPGDAAGHLGRGNLS